MTLTDTPLGAEALDGFDDGFRRPEAVIEIEQMGADPGFQGRGLSTKLMEDSLDEVVAWLFQKNNRIESHVSVVVWVYGLNFNAIKVYTNTFTEGVTGMRTQYGTGAEPKVAWPPGTRLSSFPRAASRGR